MNYALQQMSKETFVRLVTADQPDTPQYFTLRSPDVFWGGLCQVLGDVSWESGVWIHAGVDFA
jgi:hypothetical protein